MFPAMSPLSSGFVAPSFLAPKCNSMQFNAIVKDLIGKKFEEIRSSTKAFMWSLMIPTVISKLYLKSLFCTKASLLSYVSQGSQKCLFLGSFSPFTCIKTIMMEQQLLFIVSLTSFWLSPLVTTSNTFTCVLPSSNQCFGTTRNRLCQKLFPPSRMKTSSAWRLRFMSPASQFFATV